MSEFGKCQQCVEENRRSIETNGYGYGSLGNMGNCARHNKKKEECEKCLKIIDDFNNGRISACADYIGFKGECLMHDRMPIDKNINAFSKWTDGQPYERSRRLKHVQELENREFSAKMSTDAYSSALNHDENTWDVLNQGIYGGFKVSNKREELDTKMNGRDMVQQIGFNPFLGESNYVNDIAIRDQFLKPINTTQGSNRVSNSNSNNY